MSDVYLEHWGQVLRLPLGETLVGRARRCRLRFSDPTVSRVHLRIIVTASEITAEDLNSRAGSWINGKRLDGRCRLGFGDVLRVGTREFTLQEQVDTSRLTHEIIQFNATDLANDALADDEQAARLPTAIAHDAPARASQSRAYRPRHPTEPLLSASPERRRGQRVRTSIPGLYASQGLLLHGTVRDVSERGLFFASDLLDAPGAVCQVDIMPEQAPTLTFSGIVRHVVDATCGRSGRPPGFGIEFTDVPDEARIWLSTFLAQQDASRHPEAAS